jgi:predicted SAM-dependent methyltransferase
MTDARAVRRLHWGCGSWTPEGWINSDIADEPGVDLRGDILAGLPLDDDAIDYAVSIHALPELHLDTQVSALRELRRVLKPGGVLRLGLPNLLNGVAAYERGERGYFLVPDEDAASIGSKLVLQLMWYGHIRTLFVPEFIEELLRAAGFPSIHHVGFQQTRSPFPEIVALDNREDESLFVEAVK